jgi:predicted GH43/DUF377 family glycosyl hydrolase
MRKILAFCFLMALHCSSLLSELGYTPPLKPQQFITGTKRIYIPEYSGAWNPSIVKFNDGYLLTFRYSPDRYMKHWISYIGVMLLDRDFEPISEPRLLDTRVHDKRTPSQSEDARVFSSNGKLYVIYNDNMELEFPQYWERRDMYLAELLFEDGSFLLSDPIKLIYEEKYRSVPWQKNWVPFDCNGTLLLSYTLNPHEIIQPNLATGSCQKRYESSKSINWSFGELLGGTPALLVDGEYLAFFHSRAYLSSLCSEGGEMWHYFMGAYTFSAEPPFKMTSISEEPADILGFYTYTPYFKRVIYPSGFVEEGSTLYLAYGKNDYEIWIATIDLNELKKTMVPVNQ